MPTTDLQACGEESSTATASPTCRERKRLTLQNRRRCSLSKIDWIRMEEDSCQALTRNEVSSTEIADFAGERRRVLLRDGEGRRRRTYAVGGREDSCARVILTLDECGADCIRRARLWSEFASLPGQDSTVCLHRRRQVCTVEQATKHSAFREYTLPPSQTSQQYYFTFFYKKK